MPLRAMTTFADLLDALIKPGDLYRQEAKGAVRCFACGHRCLIRPGRRGICQVRFNRQGALMVPHGYVASLQCDPIEKKPFYHLLPGSDALTFGMLGCDFHCSYCQNWLTSQALRDPQADGAARLIRRISPLELVGHAKRLGARAVVSSYNEPLITAEWAKEVFTLAREEGFLCAFVSNGNATREVLDYLRPVMQALKVDLKSMQDRQYRRLGGVLDHVLDTVRMAYEMGFWVEVVTLVVPGFNDSPGELREAARFIASVSPDIPWHVTGFHQDYKMTDTQATPASKLIQAAEIGRQEGLRFVYAGNRPGQVEDFEHTRCPQCQEILIRRLGFLVLDYSLSGEGKCPHCGEQIPGIWPGDPGEMNQEVGAALRRAPRRVL